MRTPRDRCLCALTWFAVLVFLVILPSTVLVESCMMKSELNRLNSFSNWPANTGVDPTELARAGFYYTGQGDLVKCFSCGIGVHSWCPGDDPEHEHQLHCANCPFLINPSSSGNVPIQSGPEETNSRNNRENQRRSRSQVSHPSESSEIPIRLEPVKSRMRTHIGNDSINSLINLWELLHIVTDRPKCPKYKLLANRTNSFKNWPKEHILKGKKLAEAGFYYTGVGDRVRCFFCNGGLEDWEHNDNPWEEHEHYFGNCGFIQMHKGQHQEAHETEHPEENLNIQTADDGDTMRKLEKEIQQLKKENQQLKDQRLCKICREKDRTVVFLPCGHMCSCEPCAERLRKCPICNILIRATVKAF